MVPDSCTSNTVTKTLTDLILSSHMGKRQEGTAAGDSRGGMYWGHPVQAPGEKPGEAQRKLWAHENLSSVEEPCRHSPGQWPPEDKGVSFLFSSWACWGCNEVMTAKPGFRWTSLSPLNPRHHLMAPSASEQSSVHMQKAAEEAHLRRFHWRLPSMRQVSPCLKQSGLHQEVSSLEPCGFHCYFIFPEEGTKVLGPCLCSCITLCHPTWHLNTSKTDQSASFPSVACCCMFF